jgi:hypothetical protein
VLRDTLRSVRAGGTVCFTGMLSDVWTIPDFCPLDGLPNGVRLTAYSGDARDLPTAALQAYLDAVSAGTTQVPLGRTYPLAEIVQAHHDLDAGRIGGKAPSSPPRCSRDPTGPDQQHCPPATERSTMSDQIPTRHDLAALPEGAVLRSVTATPTIVEGQPALRIELTDAVTFDGRPGVDYVDQPTFVTVPATFTTGLLEVDIRSRLPLGIPTEPRSE